MPKTTLITTLVAEFVSLIVMWSLPLLSYWDGRLLADPLSIYSFFHLGALDPLNLFKLLSPLILLLALLVFVVGVVATIVHMVRGKISPAWGLVVIVPLAVFFLQQRFLPLPSLLDGAETAITSNVPESQLLSFARHVRLYDEVNRASDYPAEITGQLLEKFPKGLISRFPGFYDLREDHVFVTYGPRLSQWGIIISDVVIDGERYEPIAQGNVDYVQIYDSVWLYRNNY